MKNVIDASFPNDLGRKLDGRSFGYFLLNTINLVNYFLRVHIKNLQSLILTNKVKVVLENFKKLKSLDFLAYLWWHFKPNVIVFKVK